VLFRSYISNYFKFNNVIRNVNGNENGD